MSKDHNIHSPEAYVSFEPAGEPAGGSSGTDYSLALARVRACVRHRVERLREESRRAAARVDELVRQPQARRRWMIHNSQRYGSWFVCDQLLERCSKTWFRSPESALELAKTALQVAGDLDPEVHGAGPVEDLRTLAVAYAGNCLRLMGRGRSAARCLRLAWESRAAGSGDQLLEARILTLKAFLRVDEGSPREALRLLGQAQDLYFQTGDDSGIGKILAVRGSLLRSSGDPLGAAWALRRALRRIEPARNPDLHLKVRHELICCALVQRDLHQASRLLEATRDRLGSFGPVDLGRYPEWFQDALVNGPPVAEVAERAAVEAGGEAGPFWS